MDQMGVWSLKPYGLHEVLSTNRSESWNALLKREFVKKRGYTEDEIICISFQILKRRLLRVKRAKHRTGEKWMIRDQLKDEYIFKGKSDATLDEKKENDSEKVFLLQLPFKQYSKVLLILLLRMVSVFIFIYLNIFIKHYYYPVTLYVYIKLYISIHTNL